LFNGFKNFIEDESILAYFLTGDEHVCNSLGNELKCIQKLLVGKYFLGVVTEIDVIFTGLFFYFEKEIVYVIIRFLFYLWGH
jgi:hypothetical protein